MRSILNRRVLPLCLLAGLAACATQSGASHLNARVLSLNQGGQDAASLQPVAGARLTLDCPQTGSRDLGTTGADGEVGKDLEGSVSMSCAVQISQDGFRTMRVPMAEVCAAQSGDTCRELNVRSVLQHGAAGTTASAR